MVVRLLSVKVGRSVTPDAVRRSHVPSASARRTPRRRVSHPRDRAVRAGVAHDRGRGGTRECGKEPTASLRLRSK
ncbi:hypothetical protein CFB89_30285 [Burkholderia sp. AU16741]|nr:hypothetical protein CFB89_30285 [Burkholderia sp. AU16741]